MRRLAAVLLVAATACGGSDQRAARTPAGDPTLEAAHDFSLPTFEGDTFRLSDHFGELPVVLNFWAPW